MKIAIIGVGAIGGYVGIRLALAGEEVTFIARGANLRGAAHTRHPAWSVPAASKKSCLRSRPLITIRPRALKTW